MRVSVEFCSRSRGCQEQQSHLLSFSRLSSCSVFYFLFVLYVSLSSFPSYSLGEKQYFFLHEHDAESLAIFPPTSLNKRRKHLLSFLHRPSLLSFLFFLFTHPASTMGQGSFLSEFFTKDLLFLLSHISETLLTSRCLLRSYQARRGEQQQRR